MLFTIHTRSAAESMTVLQAIHDLSPRSVGACKSASDTLKLHHQPGYIHYCTNPRRALLGWAHMHAATSSPPPHTCHNINRGCKHALALHSAFV
jgi:hypothetical protein